MDLSLSDTEKHLLQRLQAGIPVASRPFDLLGREIQMGEAQVIDYLLDWKKKGVIRWIGAIFSTNSLGYQSTLAALSLNPDKIVEAAHIINQHQGVTHNYQREHDYNLWFTLAIPPGEDIDTHVKNLAQSGGAKKWITLPVVRTYKISLVLPITEKEPLKQDPGILSNDHSYSLTEEEKALVRVLQEDWPLVPTPYAILARQWAKKEECLMEKIREWKTLGIIRRVAAILRHHEAGFSINWMVAWRVGKEMIDFAGEQAARCTLVSHCYQRRVTGDWPYQLFTMLHARSQEEAQSAVKELRKLIEPLDYKILPTIREFKKVRLKLFV